MNGSAAQPARFAILADDLTGALDCAAAFIFPGYAPYVAILGDVSDAPAISRVISVNADTRRLLVDAASRVTGQLLANLSSVGIELRYVKIDSTLRGHPGLEVSQCAELSGAPVVLFCPSFPGTGRTVRDGNLLVHGVPLHQTEVGNDPLSPLTTSKVADILRRSPGMALTEVHLDDVRSSGLAETLVRLAETSSESPRIVICDAETDSDLDRVVAAGVTVTECALHRTQPLFAGSAGLAAALARASQDSSIHNVKTVSGHARRPFLIVTASLRSLADRQIATLESAGQVSRLGVEFAVTREGTAHIVHPDMTAVEAHFAAGNNVALRATIVDDLSTLSPAVVRKAADEVTAQLGQVVRRLAEQNDIGGIVIVGGDTAYGILTATGARGILLHAEPLPGVPVGTISGGSLDGTVIATKAGAFGDDQTLLNLVNFLPAGGDQP